MSKTIEKEACDPNTKLYSITDLAGKEEENEELRASLIKTYIEAKVRHQLSAIGRCTGTEMFITRAGIGCWMVDAKKQ